MGGVSALVGSVSGIGPLTNPVGVKNAWQVAVELHVSQLSKEQRDIFSTPTGLDDLVTLLKKAQRAGKRSKTSKLLEFLDKYSQPLQQFQGAIDVAAQTNAGIGCPIWAPMKLLFIIIGKHTRAQDILAEQLTKLVSALPRYEKYEHIFQSSEILQEALGNLYSDYINFCVRVVKHFTRNGFRNLFRSFGKPFEDEFKEILAAIKQHGKDVDANALAAHMEGGHKTHLENLTFQEKNDREKTLTWLCPSIFDSEDTQYLKNWVPETCQWILSRDEYLQWRSPDNPELSPRLLWISGNAGVGKTFISHFVLKKLETAGVPTVSFFFNSKQEDSGKRTAIAFLRTLIHQLLDPMTGPKANPSTYFPILKELRAASGHEKANSFNQLWRIAADILSSVPNLHIILDALDECDPLERADLMEKLSSLCRSACSLKIVITSRPELDLDEIFKGIATSIDLQLRFQKNDVNPDIQRYVQSRIQKSRTLKNPSVKNHVESVLTNNSDGMFLYVRLMLDELEQEPTAKEVHKRLNRLPKDLLSYYHSVLDQIAQGPEGNRQLARNIFLWVITAQRPLTIQGLIVALRTQRLCVSGKAGSSDEPLDDELLDPESQIVSACFPLVEVVEDGTVQVVHTSVTQYLLNQSIDGQSIGIKPVNPFVYHVQDAHDEVAHACITHLSMAAFTITDSTESAAVSDPSSLDPGEKDFLVYATMSWPTHVSGCQEYSTALSDTLLEFCEPGNKSFFNWTIHRSRLDFRFKVYFRLKTARIYPTSLHIAVYFQLSKLAERLIHEDSSILEKKDGSGGTPLHVAADQGFGELVQILQQSGAENGARDQTDKTPLHRAAINGRVLPTELLLSAAGDIDTKDKFGRTALFLASQHGRKEVVSKLLENGARLDHTSNSQDTPISIAAANGYHEVLEILLQKAPLPVIVGPELLSLARSGHTKVFELLREMAEINVNFVNKLGQTAIELAAEKGHESMVKLLLHAHVDSETINQALCMAARRGHDSVVQRLLEAGAEVNVDPNHQPARFKGCTALYFAALGGNDSVVQKLLAAGADPSEGISGKRGPLHIAASFGHHSIVQQLLNANEIRGQPLSFRNLSEDILLNAVASGHERVVRQLLSLPSSTEDHKVFMEALRKAASAGNGSVVQLLMDTGADAVSMNRALVDASRWGQSLVVRQLLDAGARPRGFGFGGRTALRSAAQGGYSSIVQQLLEAGANINDINDTLCYAAESGYVAIVQQLMTAGAKTIGPALRRAAGKGHEPLVKQLLAVGADTESIGKALYSAAESGHESVVRQLLDAGTNAASINRALASAMREKSTLVVQQLLSAGAEIKISDISLLDAAAIGKDQMVRELLLDTRPSTSKWELESALDRAAANGHNSVVQVFIDEGIDTARHGIALYCAAENGHGSTVQQLLDAGANGGSFDPALCGAAKGGHLLLVRQLLGYVRKLDYHNKSLSILASFGDRTLTLAAKEGHDLVVQELLNYGMDIKGKNEALENAAERGHDSVVRLLLDAGADPNTALSRATSFTQAEVTRILLESGADPNGSDRWGTPIIHSAVKDDQHLIMQYLLEAGCDVDLVDSRKLTALHMASICGREVIAEELLAAGADTSIRDVEGKTPLDYAIEKGKNLLISLLSE